MELMQSGWFRRIALAATALALVVVVMGAWVRLSDAGLGCPDWPVCYGKAAWPVAPEDVEAANAAFPERPVAHDKTWREQVHRHAAATLGLLVLAMALLANWRNRKLRTLVLAGAGFAALGTLAYILGKARGMQILVDASAVFAVPAVLVPLYACWRARADFRASVSAGLLGLIIFQAMLGMWTVTLLLKPIIVTGHLLGGLTTLALLGWTTVRTYRPEWRVGREDKLFRRAARVGLLLVALQIALGGWVSTNYAAVACPDFPTCQGEYWPDGMDFAEGFVLWRGVGVDYEGGVLDHSARVAIHHTHRVGALVLSAFLTWLVALAMVRTDIRVRLAGIAVAGGLLFQLAIGVGLIHSSFALPMAVAHNAGAALLLLTLVLLNHVLSGRSLEARA